MAQAATAPGKVICFRCRRAIAGLCPRCAGGGAALEPGALDGGPAIGVWLAGAVLLGSILGAALSLIH